MASTKEEKIKNLESKLKEIVGKEKENTKDLKGDVKIDTKKIKEAPVGVSPEIQKQEKLEEIEQEKRQINFPNSVSELKTNANFRAQGLEFDDSVIASSGGRLESNLNDIPSNTVKDEQRKKEEAYQTAKLMYEESEGQRRIDVGREVMQARVVSPLAMNTAITADAGRRVGMLIRIRKLIMRMEKEHINCKIKKRVSKECRGKLEMLSKENIIKRR